jgi:hypothetical protein
MRIFTFVTMMTIFIGLCSVIIYKVFESYGIFKNPMIHKTVLGLLIIFPIILILTHLVGYNFYSKINSIFYTMSVIWFGALLYVFIASLFLGILYFFIKTMNPSLLFFIASSCIVMYRYHICLRSLECITSCCHNDESN